MRFRVTIKTQNRKEEKEGRRVWDEEKGEIFRVLRGT
jgi:hypothetical protein